MIPKHHQPRLRDFSLRKCEGRPFSFLKTSRVKALKKRRLRLPILKGRRRGTAAWKHPEIWNLQINWFMTWFPLKNFGNFCQMVSSVTVNSRLLDTSLLRALPKYWWNAYTNYAEEFANWLKRSFLGVADFTGDDDDIAKVHHLINFRPRLQNLDFDGLECNHVNSRFQVGTKLRLEKTTEIN